LGTFWGSCTQPPLLKKDKFGVLEQTQGLRLHAKFCLNGFILSPSGNKNPQILPFFGLRHFVVSPTGGDPKKLNKGAQLQTFPYPTVSISLLYSNSFMAKSFAQTMSFKAQ